MAPALLFCRRRRVVERRQRKGRRKPTGLNSSLEGKHSALFRIRAGRRPVLHNYYRLGQSAFPADADLNLPKNACLDLLR